MATRQPAEEPKASQVQKAGSDQDASGMPLASPAGVVTQPKPQGYRVLSAPEVHAPRQPKNLLQALGYRFYDGPVTWLLLVLISAPLTMWFLAGVSACLCIWGGYYVWPTLVFGLWVIGFLTKLPNKKGPLRLIRKGYLLKAMVRYEGLGLGDKEWGWGWGRLSNKNL